MREEAREALGRADGALPPWTTRKLAPASSERSTSPRGPTANARPEGETSTSLSATGSGASRLSAKRRIAPARPTATPTRPASSSQTSKT
jgi:hypothetical protein